MVGQQGQAEGKPQEVGGCGSTVGGIAGAFCPI